MKKIKFLNYLCLILFTLIAANNLNAEIIILSSCDNKKDGFLKNEYILDLEKSLMTRNFVYNNKTFKKYRITDLSVKKENTLTKFIYQEDNKILTDDYQKVEVIDQDSLDETSKEIVSILDEYIKPSVAADGGNIMFKSYDKANKSVSVILQGACSGCPSSTITLKNGIENILKKMLNGKVEVVEAINE